MYEYMWPSASLKAGGSQVFIEYIPDCFHPLLDVLNTLTNT